MHARTDMYHILTNTLLDQSPGQVRVQLEIADDKLFSMNTT